LENLQNKYNETLDRYAKATGLAVDDISYYTLDPNQAPKAIREMILCIAPKFEELSNVGFRVTNEIVDVIMDVSQAKPRNE